MLLNYFVVRGGWMFRFYPELHFVCKGLSTLNPYTDFCI